MIFLAELAFKSDRLLEKLESFLDNRSSVGASETRCLAEKSLTEKKFYIKQLDCVDNLNITNVYGR